MRYCGIIIIVLLAACKAAVPTSRSAYSEDLSVLRPKVEVDTLSEASPTIQTEPFVPLQGHIKSEMDSIVKVSIAQNKEGKLVEGYILLVYTGNDRDEANSVWVRLDSNFPELNPKISYRQPNFQVRAGKFTDRLEAYRTLQAVQEEFPKTLLVPERLKISYE